MLRHDLQKSARMTSRRFLAFNQELLVLLRSGLPIMQIFDTQIEQMEAGGVREVLGEIREEIRGGSSLSDAFAKFPRSFPPFMWRLSGKVKNRRSS